MTAPPVSSRRRSTWQDRPPFRLDRYWRKARTRSGGYRAFIKDRVKVPSGRGVGKPMHLHPYQDDILRRTFDGEALTIIASLPRGAGKSGLSAALTLGAALEEEAAEVYIASTSLRTARIPYDRIVRMIELDPELSEQAVVHRSAADPYIEFPGNGSVIRPMPAEERYLVGLAPGPLVVVDEVGFVSMATYRVLSTALGKRDCRLIGVGTPGLGTVESVTGEPNIMWHLREQHQAGTNKYLDYIEYAADPNDDPGDPATWRRANPGLRAGLVSMNAYENDHAQLPAHTFAMYRLGLWQQGDAAYVRQADWDRLEVVPGLPPPGATVALGFDGSASQDSTGVVMTDLETNALHVLGHWSPPAQGKGWRVPRHEVDDVVQSAFSRYRVIAMWCDPWLWREEILRWQTTYGADVVLEKDSSRASVMSAGADRLQAAVEHNTVRHDGNPALRAHMLSCVTKVTPAGEVLTRDARKPASIDLAIAAVLSHEAAAVQERPPTFYAV